MAEYDISRTTGKCFVSGRPLQENEEFYSVILQGEAGIERRDFSLEAWQGPPHDTFCFFKTRLPKKDEPKRTFISDELLVEFFHRLESAEDPAKQRFRFVLSLILLRKRLLKFEKTTRESGKEFLDMRMVKDKSLHRVLDPALDETEIEELTRELSSVLQGYADASDDAGEEKTNDQSHTPSMAGAEGDAST